MPPLIATLEVNSHRRLLDIMHLEYVNPRPPAAAHTHLPPAGHPAQARLQQAEQEGQADRVDHAQPVPQPEQVYIQSIMNNICCLYRYFHDVNITTVCRTAKAVERFLCNLGRPTDQRNQPVPKKRPGNALGLPSALGPAFKDKDKAGKMKIGMKMR